MPGEREAAPEPTNDFRVFPLPASPPRKWPQGGKLEFVGDSLEQQIGERNGRFADCESRMAVALPENDGEAEPAKPASTMTS
jgi:hypothetical protein